MTAGQIAAPYRQIRTSLLVAALAVAFGLGLLIGLVAQRAANTGALAITNGGAPAAVAGANSRVGAPAVDFGAQNFRGAQDIRAASSGPGMSSPDLSAASTGSGTYADYLALLRAKRDGGATAKFGAVHKPYPL